MIVHAFASLDGLFKHFSVNFVTASVTRFDRALDAAYIADRSLGGLHRILDGSHTLVGAWKAVQTVGAPFLETVCGYVSAVWKDFVTPRGIPIVTLSQSRLDGLSASLHLSKTTMSDLLSVNLAESLSAALPGASMVYAYLRGNTASLAKAGIYEVVLGLFSFNIVRVGLGAVALAFTGFSGVLNPELLGCAALQSVLTGSTFLAFSNPFSIAIVVGIGVLFSFLKELDWQEFAKLYPLTNFSLDL